MEKPAPHPVHPVIPSNPSGCRDRLAFGVRTRNAELGTPEPGTVNRSAYFNSRIRMFFHATSNGPVPFLMPWT